MASPVDQHSDKLLERFFATILTDYERAESVNSLLEEHPGLVNVRSKTRWGLGKSTPLIEACYKGSPILVKILLDKGANTSATGHVIEFSFKNRSYDIYDGDYGTYDEIFPLYVVTKKGRATIVEDLLQAGAQVNQTNAIGQSALHMAVMNPDGSDPHHESLTYDDGDDECVSVKVLRKLIDYGADVNLQDKNGKAPLHYACAHGNRHMVEILLTKQANINIRDHDGQTALEIASQRDYSITEMIIAKCDLNVQQVIEAYETSVFLWSCQSPYEALSKATQLRIAHDIPKVPLEPMECYDFHKEFETLEDLRRYESEEIQLRMQSVLAGERIFHGRYFSFTLSQMDKLSIVASGKNQLNALMCHYLDIFCKNDDYLHFNRLIVDNQILKTLLCPIVELYSETVSEFNEVAIVSCRKMQNALEVETKPGTILQLIRQLEKTFFILGGLIMHLIKKDDQSENEKKHSTFVVQLYRNLWQEFPWVVCSTTGYRTPLPHVLFNNKDPKAQVLLQHFPEYQYNLMKVIIDSGFDLNCTDSAGNTLLHIIIFALRDEFFRRQRYLGNGFSTCAKTTEKIVFLLLEEGAYVNARNKKRETVMDLFKQPLFHDCHSGTQIVNALSEYNQFPKLKNLAAIKLRQSNFPYLDQLPAALAQFVDLH